MIVYNVYYENVKVYVMKLYRAMCDKELEETLKYSKPAFNKRFKWFSTQEFVINRVQDGKFNNSSFSTNRYKNLVEFDISDNYLKYFKKCGFLELMLSNRDLPLIKFNSIIVIDK